MIRENIAIITGNSNRLLAENICKCLVCPLCDIELSTFPDGETGVVINGDIYNKDVFVIQSCDYPANQNYMELFIILNAVRGLFPKHVTAVLPFLGYSRQDKENCSRPSMKLIADLLVSAGADRILAMDLHSQQVEKFFEIPINQVSVFDLLVDHFRTNNLVICSPDRGRVELAARYAKILQCDLAIISKHRLEGGDVEVTGMEGEVSGRNILLIDDMTVTFGTLNAAAKFLKNHGACRIQAAVAHCLLTDDGYTLFRRGDIEELVTTNSTGRSYMLAGRPGITVLDISKIIGEKIFKIYCENNK